MQITFRLTPEDLVESQQGYHRALRSLAEKYMYAFSLFIWSLVFLDGAFLVYRRVSRGQTLGAALQTNRMMMVVSLLLIAVSLFNLRRGPRGNFKAPGYLGDQTFEIAEEGISIHAPERLTRQLGWAEISRYTETENLFLLLSPWSSNVSSLFASRIRIGRFLYSIPKRALAPGETEELRNLLRRKLPLARYSLPQPGTA